jgi:hypothetical protein
LLAVLLGCGRQRQAVHDAEPLQLSTGFKKRAILVKSAGLPQISSPAESTSS